MEKGSFHFQEILENFREIRDSRGPPDCGKQRRIRPFSRDSREFRDLRESRGSSSEKTAFVMTPFPGPEKSALNLLRGLSKVDELRRRWHVGIHGPYPEPRRELGEERRGLVSKGCSSSSAGPEL